MFSHREGYRAHGGRPGSTQLGIYRVGIPLRLDARALADGLDGSDEAEVVTAEPAELRRRLCDGRLDAALLSPMDLQAAAVPLTVLPAGCIAVKRRSLAARLYSHGPAEELACVSGAAVAPTSAALVRLLWASEYQTVVECPPWEAEHVGAPTDGQGAVLEGDAVMTRPPLGFDHQFDICRMWHDATGLPFVFAFWAAHPEHPKDCERLYRLLLTACRTGREHLEDTARRLAAEHGWPGDLARRYLFSQVQLEFTDACRDGLEEFFFLAAGYDVIERYRPVAYYEP